ncbi:MAG: bifunctional metallophosphatase/5'-nucleotidase [Deltaproteobacteria bacterium]|nr:bifunctional metallophosphatase/5'-nucleotidase [Deltaproteobacteria bacterium]
MKRILHIFTVALLFFVLSTSCAFSTEPSTIGITILHINDTHGHILQYLKKSISSEIPVGGAAQLAAMIHDERIRNPHGTLLLSGGDMFQGTPISNIFRGKPVIEIMNYLTFDAMVIGNHEFDWKQDALMTMIRSADFPVLSANIMDTKGHYIPAVQPYIILERKGLKIAIIGITTVETVTTTKPDNVTGLTFLDPEKILPPLLQDVRNRGADVVIVLSHSGLDADRKLAKNVDGIDVIVGGHTHTAVTDPVVVDTTIIVQAGCFGLYLGVLELTIHRETKRIVHWTRARELKTVFSGPDNPADIHVAGIINKYNNRIKDVFTRVVGETTVDLVQNRRGESNEGNLLCDAMRQETGASIAFFNSGGLKITIPRGKITMEAIYELLPYDNVLMTMDLTGRQIRELMEHGATLPHGGILQTSGISVTYDFKKPVGERVVNVDVGNNPLNPMNVYTVTTNDFLAAGGDGYTTFKEGENIRYGDSLRDVFVEYIKKLSPVGPKIEGRIVIRR